MPTRRLGLSFEILQPTAAHPSRTDIACFVGTVARRRAREPVRAMPEVLARWLESRGVGVPQLPLRTRRVDLGSAQRLKESLRAALQGSGMASRTLAALIEVLDEAAARQPQLLEALLGDCRELSPLPAAVIEDLRSRGFHPGGHLAGEPLAAWLRIQRLADLPVVVDSFEAFDALFAWDERPVFAAAGEPPGAPHACTALGAAVRAFFGEGGARCYIVRHGDPVPVLGAPAARFAPLVALGIAHRGEAVAAMDGPWTAPAVSTDPAEWRGLQHVFGLAEVSLVAMPDLPEAVAGRKDEPPPVVPPAGVPREAFGECAEEPAPPPPRVGRLLLPPRADDDGLQAWMLLVRRALALLGNRGRSFHRRDVQLLASLPLAELGRGAPRPDEWMAWMAKQSAASAWWSQDEGDPAGDAFARLQVAYPWLATRESADCPGGVEAPEGTLAGVLARNALARGAYRSAAFLPIVRYIDADPPIHLTQAVQHTVDTPAGPLALAERVCLIGAGARGPQLWSDVTFAGPAPWRQGCVRRLVNVVVNAAQRAGDEHAFDTNGEALWAQVRQGLEELGRELLAAGALSSDAGERAFVVRCGRDTMTQADLDAGRLVAEIELVAAQPILRIVVVLALRDAQPGFAVRAAA